MKKSIQMLGILVLFLISICLIGPPILFGIPVYGRLCLGVGAFFLGLALFFTLGAFENIRTYRKQFVASFAVLCVVTYVLAIKHFTNPVLSSFFKTGTSCTEIRPFMGLATSMHIAQLTEDTCYTTAMKVHAMKLPTAEASSYILESVTTLKSQNRLSPTVFILVLAIDTMVRTQQKKEATNPEQKFLASLGLVTDMTNLMELYPLPEGGSFAAQEPSIDQTQKNPTLAESQQFDKDFILANNTKIERKAIARMIVTGRKSINKIAQNPNRLPSSESVYASLLSRIDSIQARWNFSEADLVTLTAKEITKEEE